MQQVLYSCTVTTYLLFQPNHPIPFLMLPLPMMMIFVKLVTMPACLGLPSRILDTTENTTAGHTERANTRSSTNLPPDHRDGGLPLISDSLFSLIIMIYVLLAFFFVFFLFCWKRGPDRPLFNNKARILI